MDSEKSENSSTEKSSRAGCCKSSVPICSTVRIQRNQAEKQRRDRMNGFISELANIVPMVKNSSKPVDKVSILRLAAAHMRLDFSCLNPKKFNSKIPALPASLNLEIVEKNIGGFIIVTTFAGVVLFCSKCIEDFVGYQCIDLIGQSIYNYVDPKEVPFFEKKVNSAILRGKKEKNATKVIKLHLQQRPLPRSTEVRYRKMLFKLSIHSNNTLDSHSSKSKSSHKSKKIKHKDFGASSVVLMFIEPMKMEPKINRAYLLTHQDIYFTIHGLQGEIMYADQRIATITGYMPQDVQGISAYQYIMESDVPIALFAQKAMFTSSDGTGSITYRLRIFDSSYIYLQSKGQIIYKDNSTEMSHFVCYNKWMSEEEGNRALTKFQERYAPQILDSKATDIQEKNSKQSQLFKSSKQNSNDTVLYSTTSNNPLSVQENSNFIHSGSVSPEYGLLIENNLPGNSATSLIPSSNEYINGFPNLNAKNVNTNTENYSIQTCTSGLKDCNETPAYNLDEFEKDSQDKNSYLAEAHAIKNQSPILQATNSSYNQLCFTDKSEILNVSKSLNGKKGFSVTHLQSQAINQVGFSQNTFLSQLNLEEIGNSMFESSHHSIQHSGKLQNKKPPLVNDISSFLQVYSPVQEPINGFCTSEKKLPKGNIVSEKRMMNLNPVFKATGNQNLTGYSSEFRNGNYAMHRYESNGHYNMHSSYTSPENCYKINVSSEFDNETSFVAQNGAPNGTNFNSTPLCNGSFASSCDVSLRYNGDDLYCHNNGFNAPNKSSLTMSGGNHIEVQKQIIARNKPITNTYDAYLNPMYAIPAKRIKTDAAVSGRNENGNGDVRFINLLDDNDCQDLFSEGDLNNEVGNFFQDTKTSSFVKESTIERDSRSDNYNGELYDELDIFFKNLPESTQSQLSYEAVQSTDCDNQQLNLPTVSSRNVSN